MTCRRKRRERRGGWADGRTAVTSPMDPLCCDNSVVSVLQDDWEWNYYLLLKAGGMTVSHTHAHTHTFSFHIPPPPFTHRLQSPGADGTRPPRLVK